MSTIKEILAAVGLAVLAFGLGWAIGEQHTKNADVAAYAPIKAARDSLATIAASSEKQHTQDAQALDSLLAAMGRLTGRVDTVRKTTPAKADTIPVTDSAALLATRDSLEQLRAVSQQVAKACSVVEQDCAQVRAQRDSLLRLTEPAKPTPPTVADTSTRLTAAIALLYDPIAKLPAARGGAYFRIAGGWSIEAEAMARVAHGDSLRFYVGAVKQWSIW